MFSDSQNCAWMREGARSLIYPRCVTNASQFYIPQDQELPVPSEQCPAHTKCSLNISVNEWHSPCAQVKCPHLELSQLLYRMSLGDIRCSEGGTHLE